MQAILDRVHGVHLAFPVRVWQRATCPVSRLYGQVKPELINASPSVGTYAAFLDMRPRKV